MIAPAPNPLWREIRRARERGVPLIAVRTADQPAALRAIVGGCAQDHRAPIAVWDPVRGLSAGNEAGAEACARMVRDQDPLLSVDATTTLEWAALAPSQSAPDTQDGILLVMLAGDRALAEARPATAAVLLRDLFAASCRTLVALGAGWQPAPELGSDVHVVDDALPDDTERTSRIVSLLEEQGYPHGADVLRDCCAYTRGLSRFAIDQAIALALNDKGVKVDLLARLWREAIDRTPGLRVESTGVGTSLDDISGLASLKAHASRLVAGRARPDVIVWVDEIEKVLPTGQGALDGGASGAVFGAILTAMESSQAEGLILVGPPGTGKSLAACTMGAAAGVPTIALNPGRLKGGLVGQTEEQAERCFRTLRALGGHAYWVATSNGLASVPPELLRRFTDGVWCVDLPTSEERSALWRMYLDRYGLADAIPLSTMDRGYAGADVRNVTRTAWRDGVAVAEIMAGYVPSSRAATERIEALRRVAVGAYRSASYQGAYRMPAPEQDTAPAARRAMTVGEG